MIRLYNRFVNLLSFSNELYKYQQELNDRIDRPQKVRLLPQFHPLGVTGKFQKRRISLAEAYLAVISSLDSGSRKNRLRALKRLMDIAFHARTLAMPLNTARVQVALMKEAVKNRHNSRRQLELLYDFSRTSHGRHQVIRKLLLELNVIEAPEVGKQLKELDLGWDTHVHDTASTGRKNPTQLVIDAFIKGMSRLTIAYNHIAAYPMMMEAIEAGRITGVRVDIALEFSCMAAGKRYHFLTVLPSLERAADLKRYLKEHKGSLKTFFKGLQANQKHRLEAVKRLVNHFNQTDLKELNEGFPDDPLYQVPKIKKKQLRKFVPLFSLNKLHLGEFFYGIYKPILHNRLLHAKALLEKANDDYRRKEISEWELRIAEQKFNRLYEEFHTLNPEGLYKRYFSNPKLGESITVFHDLPSIVESLRKAGCRVRVLHPLEHGMENARRLFQEYGDSLDEVEVYNLQDSAVRDPEELLQFAHFLKGFNQEREKLGQLILTPVCGSDSRGRSPTIPGMGFIYLDKIQGKYSRAYLKKHITLPIPITQLIVGKEDAPSIVCMGKISEGIQNKSGLEKDEETIPLRRAIRYLNPTLVNTLHVGVGFLVANHFIGLFYASVWFGITGFRNMIADLVSTRGVRLREWTFRSVDFANLSRSLFWTGFSVPILGFVKAQFDILWPFAVGGLLYNIAKFFFISFSNGLYLATHNTIRGFDKKVIRGNFFRSVLSWPFAAVFAPIGDLVGVPSIVQAKFWSDVVAGMIEGGAKYYRILQVQERDVAEILPRLGEEKKEDRYAAFLDLLQLFRDQPRTRSSLKRIFKSSENGEALYKLVHYTVTDPLHYSALVQYTLEQMPRDTLPDLILLIAETYPEFREWVRGLM
ncbi:MAG: hypothetical protein N2442_04835 [Spirochaetes bacterium]|nr:hypothetical protein [Spirochaetota bacterium]